MEQYGVQERELGWDETITQDAKEFTILPEGDYPFMVKSVEKSRFNGSEKMPACYQANINIAIKSALDPDGEVIVKFNLLLHSKVEWRISEFFASIGLKKKGQPLRMNWNIAGLSGTCKVAPKLYNDSQYNDIKKFYPAPGYDQPVQGNVQSSSVSYNAPNNVQQGGYTPGKF